MNSTIRYYESDSFSDRKYEEEKLNGSGIQMKHCVHAAFSVHPLREEAKLGL